MRDIQVTNTGEFHGALDAIQPGDTIYLRAGRYGGGHIFRDVQGSPDAPITIKAYPGEDVVIDPTLGNIGPVQHFWQSGEQDTTTVFSFAGTCAYITLEGLRLENSDPVWRRYLQLNLLNAADFAEAVSYSMGHYTAFAGFCSWEDHSHNMTLRGISGVTHGFFGGWCDDLLVENCVVSSPTDYCSYNQGLRNRVLNNVFYDCPYVLHWNGRSGWTPPYRPSDDAIISGNRFQNIGNRAFVWRMQDVPSAIIGGMAIYLNPSTRSQITNNVFSNICCGIPRIDTGGVAIQISGGGNSITGNHAGGLGTGVQFIRNDGPTPDTIENNTIVAGVCGLLDILIPVQVPPSPPPPPPPAPDPVPAPVPPGVPVICQYKQFRAEYFPNMVLGGFPVFAVCENEINHLWGSGGPLATLTDQFSARYTGIFPLSGNVQFSVTADDGVRLWVDGQILIDAWKDQAATLYQASRNFAAGDHEIKVEYYERGGDAVIQVSWANVPLPSSRV